MVAFNFQKRFAPDVEDGTKLQTIRATRKDGKSPCKIGDALQLYTGMRTKSCRKLNDAVCTAVRAVRIEDRPFGGLYMDNYKLQPGGGNQYPNPKEFDNDFARADGFEDFMSMYFWFQNTHGLPFEGYLIKWKLA